MSGVVGSVAVRVVPSMSGFGSTLAKEGGAAASKQGRLLGEIMGKALIGGLAVAGAAVAGFGVYALKEFSKFEKGMNEVFTLLPGISEEAMGKMNEDTRKFVREMGIAHDEAVPALYSAISAGIPQENVFDFMEVAAQASIGGVTDMETAVDGLTSVMNAYGQENMSAEQASDLMFTAVKNGKTTFDELSGSLYNVLPTASALGVDFGDVTAAMASMTAQGTPTSVATTQLRSMMVELSKDGGETAKVFEEIAGKSFKDFIAEGGNTADALALMSEHADKTGVGVNDLFGSVEAGNAALALSGDNADAYNKNIDDMANSAGATATAYDTMDEGISRSMERIGIALSDAALQIGENLAPAAQALADLLQDHLPGAIDAATGAFENIWEALGDALDRLRDFGDWISENRQPISAFASVIGGMAASFALYRGAVMGVTAIKGAYTTAVALAAGAQRGLNAAMRANPIGVIITLIGGLVAGLTWFFTQTETGQKIWDTVWGAIKDTTAAVVDWFIGTAWPALQSFWDGMVTSAGHIWEAIQAAWSGIKDVVGAVVDWFMNTALPLVQSVWEGIAAGADWLWVAVQTVFGYIQTAFSAMVTAIGWAWDNIGRPIFDAMGAVIDWLWTSIVQPVFGFIVAAWEGLVSAFTWYWEGILKPVFELFGAIISWLWENVAKPYFQRIQEGWQKLSDALVSAWENHIWPMIESFGDFIVRLYQNYVKPALDWIVDAWNWVKDTIVSLWENHIKPAYRAQGEFALKLYNDYIKPAIDWIAEKWGWVKDAIVRLWENHIKPAYRAQGEFALKLYNDYIKPALDWISEKWEWLTGKIGDTWGTIKGHLSDFGSYVKNDVPQMVRDGVDMIDKAWRKVANFFREPINSVIDFVWNDGIKSMFDGVAKAVNSDTRLAAVPRIPAFAEGGAVRGRGTGTSDDILAKLSNGEHVLTAAEVEAIGGHDKVYDLRKRIKAGEDISPEMSRRLAGNNPSEAMLPMGGVWGWAKGAFSSVVDWTRGFLAERAEELIKPIRDGVDGYATEYGPMGKLGGGLINWSLDEVMKWVRGKDEEATSSGGGYEFTGPMVSGGVHRPARGVITSPYGMRWGRLHGGVDFAGPRGTPTFAAWDGVVHSIQNYAQGSGLSVNLSHGGGKYSHYGHNDYGGIPVRAGQSVKAGQRIGNMGMTGNTTGPHLHFETWQGGLWNRRNPNALFGVGGARSNGGLFRDKGGLLPPGVSSVLNNTGGNEFIFNQKQFENLNRLAERGVGGAGDTFIQNVNNVGSPYQDGADFKRHVSRARRTVSV